MSELFGPTFGAIENAMNFRVARQSLLSANVANADTPGYRRVELSFDAMLAGEKRLATTRPEHLVSSGADRQGYELTRGPRGQRPDGNGVDMDRELLQLSRNAGAFREQAELFSRLLSLRRIAVTGEPR